MESALTKQIRRLTLIRWILIVTLVLYIAVAVVINSEYLTVDRIRRVNSDVSWALREKSSEFRLDPEDTLDVKLFQDGCAVLTRNGISVYGSFGNLYHTHAVRYSSPRMIVSGRYILCFDRGGNDWCLTDTFTVLCSGTEAEPLISASLSDDGYFALATEKFEYKGCVTVYTLKGTALARWNSDTYLTETFFTSRNQLTAVSLLSENEKISTVFSVLDFRKGEIVASATADGAVPYGLAKKSDGTVEMLSSSGSWIFDGTSVTAVRSYPDASPGIFYQGASDTMICYPAAESGSFVEVFGADGKVLFTFRKENVLSLCCYRDLYFILAADGLTVTDASGAVREQYPCSALSVMASPETVLLRTAAGMERFGLTSD